MRLDIDDKLWATYENKLREAYRVYYDTLQKHGLAWFLQEHPDTTEEVEKKLSELIREMPNKASLADMVIIG